MPRVGGGHGQLPDLHAVPAAAPTAIPGVRLGPSGRGGPHGKRHRPGPQQSSFLLLPNFKPKCSSNAAGQASRQSAVAMAAEPMTFGCEQLLLCSECNRSYEAEAEAEASVVVKAETGTEGLRCGLPEWLVLDNKRPADRQMPHQDNHLMEPKRKWSRLCRKLHLWRSQQHDPSCFGPGLLDAPPSSWWPSACLLPSIQGELEGGFMENPRRWSPPSCPGLMEPQRPDDVKTTLALGSTLLPLSDTATSDSEGRAQASHHGLARELERRLRKNIPWQPAGTVAEIADAVASSRSYGGRKGVCLFFKGSDHASQQRAAAVIAETCCGSADQIIAADPKKFSCAQDLCHDLVSRSRARKIGCSRFVLVIHDVDHAPRNVFEYLVAASSCGFIHDRFGQDLDISGSVVIFATSELSNWASHVISLRLWTSSSSSSPGDVRRKAENEPLARECKRARHGIDLNLNLCAGSDSDDDTIPSDITHEGEGDSREHGQLHHLLESIATGVVTMDKGADADQRTAAAIRAVLVGALGREVQLEDDAAEALAAASGHFLAVADPGFEHDQAKL